MGIAAQSHKAIHNLLGEIERVADRAAILEFILRYFPRQFEFITGQLDAVVEVGEGDAMVPSVRHPITFSETPADYRLPPPGLDEHGNVKNTSGSWTAGAMTTA